MHVEVFIVPADWQFIRALQPLAVTHSRAFHPYSPIAALLSDTALKQTQCSPVCLWGLDLQREMVHGKNYLS